MKHLLELMRNSPKATAVIELDYSVLDCNEPFIVMFGAIKGRNVLDLLARDPHRKKLAFLLGNTAPGWKGGEVNLELTGEGSKLCWVEVHSRTTSGRLVHFVEFINVENFHILELAYLHKLRRVQDDELWVLDSDGGVIWRKEAQSDDDIFISHNLIEFIHEDCQSGWRRILANAKKYPGEVHSFQTRAKSDGQMRYVDLCYLADIIVGGRFYMVSRHNMPSGSRLILRLKEAWAINSDDELARRLGTNKAAIRRADAEEAVPPAWLVRTGQLTGFSIDWLLTGQGSKRRI